MTALRKPDPEAIYASHYDEVLSGEFNPLKADNISEAIGDADEMTKAAIDKALASGDKLEAMNLIERMSEAYWTKAARQYANHQTGLTVAGWDADKYEHDRQRIASLRGMEH